MQLVPRFRIFSILLKLCTSVSMLFDSCLEGTRFFRLRVLFNFHWLQCFQLCLSSRRFRDAARTTIPHNFADLCLCWVFSDGISIQGLTT
ncbi:hypothetical protein MPTK1_4g04120 [Marchantia polymorpha subsp. ruderalis]|uniref:Secreted protein n=2 Tax=Marchantia polymorpha TaxID=3197 RepID=A0AAF6B663_MARPO|nr:hypothetical protein MARPO_0044s0061 [Marchantia polymorpha]BBN07497.1 hypothetical protein Mp_4g04120 [Marchantia polymorpha subsp. ruderalis]|eukprot:PTQ39603.1 hypothetical protein MARPO_0044s0061 [Marchantia polymorpha]